MNNDINNIIEFFKNSKYFSLESEQTIESIINTAEKVNFKLGEVILNNFEINSNVFFVLTGKVRLVGEDGLNLGIIKKGEFFGLESLLNDKKTITSVRSSKATVLKISANTILNNISRPTDLQTIIRKELEEDERVFNLKSLELFNDLSLEEVRKIENNAKHILLKKGEYLFKQGDIGSSAYLLEEGKLEVRLEENNRLVSILKRDAIVGEMSILEGQPRNASIIARTDSSLYHFTKETFGEVLPKIEDKITKIELRRKRQNEAFKSNGWENIETNNIAEFYYDDIIIKKGSKNKNIKSVNVKNKKLGGLACAQQVMELLGESVIFNKIEELADKKINSNRVDNLYDVARYLDDSGYLSRVVKISYEDFLEIDTPVVIKSSDDMPSVIVDINKKTQKIQIIHPVDGLKEITFTELYEFWDKHLLMANIIPEFGKATNSYWGILKQYLPMVFPFKILFIWMFSLSFLLMLFEMVEPIFSEIIIDKVLAFHDEKLLLVMLFGISIVSIFNIIGDTLSGFINLTIKQKLESIIQTKFYNHILSLPFHEYSKYNVGDYTMRFEENVKLMNLVFGSGITLVFSIITAMYYLLFLFTQNITLTLIGISFLIMLFLVMVFSSKILRQNDARIFDTSTKEESFNINMLSGILTIKSLAAERHFFNVGMGKIADVYNATFKGAKFALNIQLITQFIQGMSSIVLLAVASLMVIENELTLGEYMAFSGVFGLLMAPILSLIGLWDEIQEVKISHERVNEVINMPVEKKSDKQTIHNLHGNISIENLYFRYSSNSNNILHHINLKIKEGQKVAFVGRSGSGKTTLLNIILGFIAPTEGRVYIDGIDTSVIDSDALRRNMGIVEQEPFLFNGTIKENICKADPDISYEEMLKIANISAVNEFIKDKPLGYDTRVGEGGNSLSGGQKQRIAIARALLRNPNILILDEATSALDAETESIIQANLDEFMQHKTVLIIAHRLSTIINADMIVVMENGTIKETGSHQELLELNGTYCELIKES